MLVGWTVLVWGPRIRNIWTDASLDTGGQVLRTLYAGIFLLTAAAIAFALTRRPDLLRPVIGVVAAWTVGFWILRGAQIAAGDHDAAFLAVHAVLAVGSIGLALNAWRSVARTGANIAVGG